MALEYEAFLEGLAIESEGFKLRQRSILTAEVEDAINGVAKPLCPVGTGEEDIPGLLQESIKILENTETHIDWGTRVPYGPEVEYGNTKDRAQPFMRPAIQRLRKL